MLFIKYIDDEIIQNPKLTVYPNPTSGIVHFIGNQQLNQSRVKVYNFSGNHIPARILANSIDLSGLPSGVYFVKAFKENESYSVGKVIKL